MLVVQLGSRAWPAQGSALLPKLLFPCPVGPLQTPARSLNGSGLTSPVAAITRRLCKDVGAKSVYGPWGFEATDLAQVLDVVIFAQARLLAWLLGVDGNEGWF